ncbi:TDT family transporter [[Clostridium] dakarense]|uniref:TDT family transporter n=1 Tax=Faecalimicrobium dakarense TaxID=1301100 RepID=UPI0004B9FAA8|nr:TDT family transporter [[Clostridium] dakarense]
MTNILKKVPIPMAGLMLALAAMGNLVLSYGEIYRNIFGVLSTILLVFMIIKIFIDFKDVLEKLKNPAIASVAPTFSMGIMILSTYTNKISPHLALSIWIIGLILHIILILYFTYKFVMKFDIKKVLPSYFVVYVGIATGSITAPIYNLNKIGEYLFWFGLVSYIILLPIILYRLFKVKDIPEPVIPTIAILTAPANLCLAGYISTFKEKDILMIGFLGTLSILIFIGVLIYLPKILKIKFYPSYSALTFPLVITAIATKQTNMFFIKQGIVMPILKYLMYFQMVLAIGIVAYVSYKYVVFLFSNTAEVKA